MTRRLGSTLLLGIAIGTFAAGIVGNAQAQRPYRDGSVWNISFIKMEPGMESAYLTYLTTDWKREQEAAKKEGLILSYKVIGTEGHTPGDWNLMLMTEFKDLATMEANGPKFEALATKLAGSDEKMRQGYKDRTAIRQVMGNRLAREVILEPK